MNEVNFDIQIIDKDLFKFSINNIYRKFTGILWIVFSITVIFITVYTWGDISINNSILLICMALLFSVMNPFLLWTKSKSQIKKNETMQKPIHYCINGKGVTISQGERTDHVDWNQTWKAVRYGNLVIIYVSSIRAFVLPVNQIGEQYDKLVKILSDGLQTRNHVK